MILTLDLLPETVQRVELARSRGANMDTLLFIALEQWISATEPNSPSVPHSLASLAGKYGGGAWDGLLVEIERNREQEAKLQGEGK